MPGKALILVGGYGTRLRPLTLDSPKPLIPFANKAIVMHQIEALVDVGVTEIILAVSYQSEVMQEYLDERATELGITITMSKEDEPLGTGGPLAHARQHLYGPEPFFVLNSDVICEFPFADILKFHKKHGGEGTIFVTKVDDPTKYGVVVADDEGKVERFAEKPKQFVGDKINAGIYVFNKEVLNRIKPVPTSIEREVFPALAADGQLYRYVLPNFWMDIGQPLDYLRGQVMYLHYLRKTSPLSLASGKHILGNVIIDSTSTIGDGSIIGPDVVIGPQCTIGKGVRIERSTVLSHCTIDNSALIRSSIIGWQSKIGAWARLVAGCVLGKDVNVSSEVFLNDIKVLPHKGVKNDELVPRVIM